MSEEKRQGKNAIATLDEGKSGLERRKEKRKPKLRDFEESINPLTAVLIGDTGAAKAAMDSAVRRKLEPVIDELRVEIAKTLFTDGGMGLPIDEAEELIESLDKEELVALIEGVAEAFELTEEEINELSKATLARYIRVAAGTGGPRSTGIQKLNKHLETSQDIDHSLTTLRRYASDDDNDRRTVNMADRLNARFGEDTRRKLKNRQDGIYKATSKLAK